MGDTAARVIVGGGAAGLMAAIAAAESGATGVVLLEGAKRPGAKILVSGGTRCNVTNVEVTERDFSGGSPGAIRKVLRAFPAPAARRFFEASGVPLKVEASGKLFPQSDRARDLLDALLRRAAAAGVELRSGVRVVGVETAPAGFRLRLDGRSPLEASRLLLSTGGLSMPGTGSDGAGLRFAQQLGHTIVPTTPALAPLLLDAAFPHAAMAGASLPVRLSLRLDGKVARRVDGPLLWTHFGASGPAPLDLSRHRARGRLEGRDAAVELSMLPGEELDSVERALVAAAGFHPTRSVARWLDERLPPSVAAVVAQQLVGIDPATRLGALTKEIRRRLARSLVDLPLPVTGDRGYAVAEATAGGVALDEVSPATMASRVVPGLFLAGEMLDVDGRLGGFNFQWAWSSGQVAGRGIARD